MKSGMLSHAILLCYSVIAFSLIYFKIGPLQNEVIFLYMSKKKRKCKLYPKFIQGNETK